MGIKHKMNVYLDNSATTRASERVVDVMNKCMLYTYYNPSSLYKGALDVEKKMTGCRERISKNHAVIFTSGGTEANNLAIIGRAQTVKKPGRVLYGATEHPSVKNTCLSLCRMSHVVQEIPVLSDGRIDLLALENLLGNDVFLICVMHVNNETGTIQPLEEIIALRNRMSPNAKLHVDGVQGYLRVECNMNGVDSYSLSGHKIHAPKGIGALIINKQERLSPMLYGGGQERSLRSGTENTPGILALSEAIADYSLDANSRMRVLKNELYQGIMESVPQAKVNGPSCDDSFSAPHILNMSLPPVRSDTMLFALEGSGILVSSGSACSSSKQKVSETLRAMNVPRQDAECAIRFSLSKDTTAEEISYTIQEVKKHYVLLHKYTRR